MKTKEELLSVNVTYEQINNFREVAQKILNAAKGKISMFLFILEQNMELTKKHSEDYFKESRKISLKFAAKDDKKFVITEENGAAKFTAENQELMDIDIEALKNKEVESLKVVRYEGEDIPENVGIYNWRYLAPFVFEPLSKEVIEKLQKAG